MFHNILAIECSGELCSVALSFEGKIIQREKHAPREHAYLVLPFIESLFEESGVTYSDLDYVCFGQGPGAFTGLRIAASMAQGIALANGIKMKGGCSLHALALQAKNCGDLKEGEKVCAVLDARMSELYWGLFEVEGDVLVEVGEPTLGNALQLVSCIEGKGLSMEQLHFIGPGCRYLDFPSGKKPDENLMLSFPRASELIKVLENTGAFIEGQESGLDLPVYLRNQVAKKPGQKNG